MTESKNSDCEQANDTAVKYALLVMKYQKVTRI